jgi:5-methylcytosine-specific restriction endonuclease McrA
MIEPWSSRSLRRVYCGRSLSTQVDHIQAYKQDWATGGWAESVAARMSRANSPQNLIGACGSCNASKGARVICDGVGQWGPSGWPKGAWRLFG